MFLIMPSSLFWYCTPDSSFYYTCAQGKDAGISAYYKLKNHFKIFACTFSIQLLLLSRLLLSDATTMRMMVWEQPSRSRGLYKEELVAGPSRMPISLLTMKGRLIWHLCYFKYWHSYRMIYSSIVRLQYAGICYPDFPHQTPTVYMTSTREDLPQQIPITFSDPAQIRSRYAYDGYPDESFGIYSCRFSADGTEVIAGGNGKLFGALRWGCSTIRFSWFVTLQYMIFWRIGGRSKSMLIVMTSIVVVGLTLRREMYLSAHLMTHF